MAKIEKLKKGTATIYPATIPQAVVDPTSGKSAREELDEKADHGYEENPKTLKEVDDDLVQLESDVSLFKEESNLKDAIQDSKIKDIESIISTMNPNQSAQLSVSGRKTISLPKNAANGGMQVKLEGLTAENEAVNGNFENGLIAPFYKVDGGGGASTLAINSSTPISGNYDIRLTITTPSTSVARPQFLGMHRAANIGDKIYLHFYAKILSGTPRIGAINIGVVDSSSEIYAGNVINGRNTRIIDVVGTSNTLGTIYFDSRSVWDMQMDNFMRINLTKTFGAGNEPTIEECDLIFSDYFEGVKSFEPTGRVRSDIGGRNFILNSNIDSRGAGSTMTHKVYSLSELIEDGETVTVTLKIDYEGDNSFLLRSQNPQITIPNGELVKISKGLYRKTFSWTNVIENQNQIGFWKSSSGETWDIIYVKLEKGNKATPWTPAPEDVLAGRAKGTGTSLYLTAPVLRSNGAVKDEIRKGANGYELVKRISEVDGTVLAQPEIIPISYGGVLSSAESGTVYHEPIIADAGVYDTKMDILLTDYPIATIVEIIKHENGVDTYLNVASAVVAGDGLSFTHPDLASGDLVLFTYAFDKESTNGNITATFYDSNVVKIDTVTGKAYKIEEVVTNGVLTRTLTEV